MEVLTARRVAAGAIERFGPVEHRFTRGHQAHVDVTAHTDPAVTIVVAFETSEDGGATWAAGGGFTVQGGYFYAKDGRTPLRWSSAAFGHEPHPSQAPCPCRLVRGTLSVEGGTVDTRLRVYGCVDAGFDDRLHRDED